MTLPVRAATAYAQGEPPARDHPRPLVLVEASVRVTPDRVEFEWVTEGDVAAEIPPRPRASWEWGAMVGTPNGARIEVTVGRVAGRPVLARVSPFEAGQVLPMTVTTREAATLEGHTVSLTVYEDECGGWTAPAPACFRAESRWSVGDSVAFSTTQVVRLTPDGQPEFTREPPQALQDAFPVERWAYMECQVRLWLAVVDRQRTDLAEAAASFLAESGFTVTAVERARANLSYREVASFRCTKADVAAHVSVESRVGADADGRQTIRIQMRV